MAINFELDQWPEIPENYHWCQKGVTRCGRYALTGREFQLTKEISSSMSALGLRPKVERKEQEIVQVDDEMTDETTDKTYNPLTFLTFEKPNASEDIKTLVDYAKEKLRPELIGCETAKEVATKVEQFLPGNWVDDWFLRLLLQIIGKSEGFHVVESLNLSI